MRLIPAVMLVFFCLSISYAQESNLPDVLKPDQAAVAEARRLGVGVFKILPRGMFSAESNSYKDEDDPIGIREGGAYYSFTTGSHSYNKIPQIGYESGRLFVGFYGYGYGFITDLSDLPLSMLDEESPELRTLLKYAPPSLDKEIRIEQRNSGGMRGLPAILGHTYALRALSYNEADTAAVFNIYGREEDGSLTIFWKKIADFPKPLALYQTDQELQQKVQEILSANGYSSVDLSIKDNVIVLSGTAPRGAMSKINWLLRDVQTRGYQNSVREQ